jgi:hypothetical protein
VRGEILVARFTDPTWTPLFPLAGGIITEVGGWLSHAAIVAREYNVTAIVGVKGVLASLKTGDSVRLHSDGRIEKVEADRRRHHRVPAAVRVALLRQGEIVQAILRNLSQTGALVEAEDVLETGQRLTIKISRDGEGVRAQVVRRDSGGGYALQFATPLEQLTMEPFLGPEDGPAAN